MKQKTYLCDPQRRGLGSPEGWRSCCFDSQKQNEKNKNFYFGKEKRFSTFADPKRGKPGSEFRGIKIQKDLLTAMVSEYKAEPRGEASKFFKEKIIM